MQKFDYTKTFVIGFGFFGISIVWTVFNTFVPLFLQAGNPGFETSFDLPNFGFSLSPALAAFVMTWDNILNVFIQPWAGAKSDRTWNRFGRRKPWMLVGVPIAFAGFILVPFATLAGSLIAVMVFVLITNFGMAIFRSPTVAWLGDLFPTEQRSKANGVINFMGGVGAAIALLGGGLIYNSFGPAAPFIATALILVLAIVIAVLYVHEPEHLGERTPEDRNSLLDNLRVVWNRHERSGVYVLLAILFWFIAYEGLQFGLSSFAVSSLGMSPGTASIYTALFAATFLVFAIPAGLIGTLLGRRPTIIAGVTGLVVVFGLGFLIVRSELTLAVALVLAGFCWAAVNVNSLPLVYDYGDEARIGAYTGLYYFSSQSAAIIGPVLAGSVVDLMGDDYRWLWVTSAVGMALALLAMRAVKPWPDAAPATTLEAAD